MRTVARLSLLLLTFLIPAGSVCTGQGVERVMRIYDCDFLLTHAPDFPGPDLTRFIPHGAEEEEAEDEEAFLPVLTPDVLVDMIKGNIHPDSWHHEKNQVHIRNYKLLATQTVEVHEEIRRFLAALRRSRMRLVNLTGYALAVKRDHFLDFFSAPTTRERGALLTPPDLDHFLGKARGTDRVRTLARVSLTAYSGQLVHAGPIKRTRFLRDLDVEIAEESFASDPIMDFLLTGTTFRLRPHIVGPGLVFLDMELATAMQLGEMNQVETGIGKVDLPARSLQSLKTTVLIPEAHGVLLAASNSADGCVCVFILLPRILGEKTGTKQREEEKPGTAPRVREHRIYDTRLLTTRIQDRPCRIPRTIDDEAEEGEGNIFGAAAEPAEEGIGLDIAELIEMIRTGVDEDTWSNTRNSIRGTEDMLVVVQRPEVHEKIDALLKRLRERRGVLISTSIRVLAVDADRLSALIPRESLTGAPLSPEALAALEKEIGRTGSVRLLEAAALTGFNRQRAHVQTLEEQAVIRNVEVEVARKTSSIDPDIRPLRTGLFFDVRPGLAGDGRTISLDLVTQYSWATRPRLAQYIEGKPYGIHKFHKSVSNLFTSVFLPDGGALVFLQGPAPGLETHRLVMLVSARVVRVKA